MFSKLFVSLATFSALASVCAQTTSSPAAAIPTSTAGLTPCILNCTTTSATAAGCNGVTDLSCLCTSPAFQTAATQCLTTQCSAADLQTALGLQKAECANIAPNSTATGTSASNSTATGTTAANSTATGTSASNSTATGASGTGAGSRPTTPATSPSPTTPATSPGSSGSSGSSNSTNPPPGTSSSAAGVAQPFALSVSHIVGLAGAIAGVISGCGLLL